MLLKVLTDNPVILAPMAGILNRPLRLAFRKLGWEVSWIGSIDAAAVASVGDGRLINILGKEEATDPSERPLVVQLMGNDAGILSSAASCLEDKVDVFDLNLGCPLHIATSKKMGTMLMEDTSRMLALITSFVRNTRRPVTAKMRLLPGDRLQETVDLARRIEDTGVSGLILHARTPEQKFSGTVSWDALRMVKMKLSIPVIGSGGIQTVNDIVAIREYAHPDGVMVGAGAIRNPFLVIEHREYLTGNAPRRKTLRDTLRFASLYADVARAQKDGSSARTGMLAHYLQYLLLRLRLDLFVRRHSLIKDSPQRDC